MAAARHPRQSVCRRAPGLLNELDGTAAVGAGDDCLARGKGFNGHETVVFAVWWKADCPAARKMIKQLGIG